MCLEMLVTFCTQRSTRLLRLSLAAPLIATASVVQALPINFGVNQAKLRYSETKSRYFHVYHDARTPHEGRMTLHALEHVRPVMERWFQVHRNESMPVVMSAVTQNASFANFITNAIELQTLGQGTRDLAWHEYAHMTMYKNLDNWLGHAGAIIHLPWMPAWFLEGLAEALSVSVGSDVMAGIERYQALSGDWPSYDRLHSLYAKFDFFERGYSTAGAFVTDILRRGNADKLPHLLQDFYDYSMPWWWPWSIVPFNDFLPMQAALENYVQRDGKQLWQEYQKRSKNFWQSQKMGPFLVENRRLGKKFSSIGGLHVRGNALLQRVRYDDELWLTEVKFNPQSHWATDNKKIKQLSPQDKRAYAYAPTEVRIDEQKSVSKEPTSHISIRPGKDPLVSRQAHLGRIYEAKHHFWWLEFFGEETRICRVEKSGSQTVACPIKTRQPKKLSVIGSSVDRGLTIELRLRESEQTLLGDRHEIILLDLDTSRTRRIRLAGEGKPLRLVSAKDQLWVLIAEKSKRSLRRIDKNGRCLSAIVFKDHILDLHGLAGGDLVLGLYGGAHRYLYRLPTKNAPGLPCYATDGHDSPLLAAMRAQKTPSLSEAIKRSSYQQSHSLPLTASDKSRLANTKPLDEDEPEDADIGPTVAASWRGRPLFIFPWIGAEDALGTQLGLVSIPLMDHMQNETLRATFLYGLESRFPMQELALTSTRFRPTINIALFRQQSWNGRFIRIATDEIINGYHDEKGGRLETTTDFLTLGGRLQVGAAFKYSHLTPYIGPTNVRKGFLAEPGGSLVLAHRLGKVRWTNTIRGRAAPEELNTAFDYNQVGGSSTINIPMMWTSSLSTGIEGSRTRGKKKRELQEVYRPLKTFVPGSGGGYNKNSFPLTDSGGLFSPVFGDTQGRAKVSWTVPIIRDLDKLIWILYLERLDFTSFYNYGGAWRGAAPRRGWDRLIRAHGYSLDLSLENKGVRFNVGMGAGQVIGNNFQVYMTTGFDALF